MSSPIEVLENSIIKFRIQSEKLVKNEVGNMEPAILVQEVKCALEQYNTQSRSDRVEIPGININAFEIQGRCTDPMVLPIGVKTCEWYECDFSGTMGKFFFTSAMAGTT